MASDPAQSDAPKKGDSHISNTDDKALVCPCLEFRDVSFQYRALMREAPILILDESTAALDPQNEWQFFQDLLTERRTKNQSIIFISHRFSSVRHADRILVLEGGKKIVSIQKSGVEDAKAIALTLVVSSKANRSARFASSTPSF